jgi:hypothetical protein
MKRKSPVLIFISVLLILTSAFSQEVIIPLNVNTTLFNQKRGSSLFLRNFVLTDTINLPFIDDFSRPGVDPFDSLWLDSSGVYINSNFSDKPYTIGIATFDGLNQFGNPYNPGSSQDSIADVLTSRPINLVVPPGDTTVWLSFFYQPQGLGDAPETGDSLILQFKDTGNVWNTIWEVDGRNDTDWQRVNIRITDLKFLFKGFQFRFYNIATVNGNRDDWNLDYVILRANTVENGSISDNALIRPQLSLLSEFTSMPYSHYKTMGVAAMKSSVDDTIYNIDYGNASYTAGAAIFQNGIQLTSGSQVVSTPVSQVFIPYNIPLNSFFFPSQSTDSADFLVKSYFSETGLNSNRFNDSSFLVQHFYNYYSYDDGSAEVGYGITGNVDVSMAYKFDVKVSDTLRGVQIYFNPTGVDVTNKLFQLTVWSNVDVGNNQSVELYRMINQKPDTFEGINGFKTYLFDTILVVGPGNIWVGIIQNEPQTLYGVGLDRNTDSRNKMYYHFDGNWYQSAIKGSWMIRPLFGKRISLVNINEPENDDFTFSLYPNPAQNYFQLNVDDKKGKTYTCQVFDCLGKLLLTEKITTSGKIGINDLSSGIYCVRLTPMDGSSGSRVQKLIVR